MTEDELVEEIRRIAEGEAVSKIALGIGDDAALWQPSRSHRSAISSDMLVEGVHFRRDLLSLEDLGWRAMAANLSDLAAMGARPVLATVALGVPPAQAQREVRDIYRGVADATRRYATAVVGGDLTRAAALTIAITVVGEVRVSNVKTRAGGKPGDVLAVSGPLGAARAGLHGEAAGAQAFARPLPRLAEGRFFAASRNVGAMMDCSDGLATDVRRLCAASGCGASLEEIPVAQAATACARRLGEDPERFALAGGEDFELLVAIRPRAFNYLAGRFERRFKRPLLRIGSLRREPGVEWRGAPVEPLGWEHFGEAPSEPRRVG